MAFYISRATIKASECETEIWPIVMTLTEKNSLDWSIKYQFVAERDFL